MRLQFDWEEAVIPLVVWPDAEGPWAHLRGVVRLLVAEWTAPAMAMTVCILARKEGDLPHEWVDRPEIQIIYGSTIDPRLGHLNLAFGTHLGEPWCLIPKSEVIPSALTEVFRHFGIKPLPLPFPIDFKRLVPHPNLPLWLAEGSTVDGDPFPLGTEGGTGASPNSLKEMLGLADYCTLALPSTGKTFPRFHYHAPGVLSITLPMDYLPVAREQVSGLPHRHFAFRETTVLVHGMPIDFLQLGNRIYINTSYLERTPGGKLIGWVHASLGHSFLNTGLKLIEMNLGAHAPRWRRPGLWKTCPGLRLSDLVIRLPMADGRGMGEKPTESLPG